MRLLLIAEKPSMMRAIKDVYSKNPGLVKDSIDFAAFHGHLMRLANPAEYDPDLKKWSLDTLPILPEKFKYMEDDAESCKRLMSQIKNGHFDAVVNACDAGREGEHIFFSFYEAHGLTLPVYRFWSSDLTEPSIKKALQNLAPAAQFEGLHKSAMLRAQLDWLTGINFSRAASLKTHKKLNIGRVISATLKIIVDREHEIRNFVPEDLFELRVGFQAKNGAYEGVCLLPPDGKQSRTKDRKAAEDALSKIGKDGVIKDTKREEKKIKAPTLYSITELQKDGAKYFGYSAAKTESIAQSLYEKEYTSYPRAECRFLPTAMIPELPKHLKVLEQTPLRGEAAKITEKRIEEVTATKDYVDDAKLTDHHAIIPTMTPVKDFNSLTTDEQNLYLLICKRFLSIFMNPYTVAATTILTESNGLLFKTTGKVEVDKGFSVLYVSKAKDVILPDVSKGESVSVTKKNIRAGKTTPPDRFSTSTLLDTMANAGRYVSSAESRKVLRDTAGIGTGATRKDILEKLEKTGMCTVSKTVFTPTDFGCAIIDAIGQRDICSPQMTADWETKLRAVESGTYKGDLQQDIQNYVIHETNDIVQKVDADLGCFDHETLGECPLCKRPVFQGKSFYLCSGYKKGLHPCSFLLPMERIGASITPKDVKLLLAGKPTGVKSMKTKAGKELKDSFVLTEKGELLPSFALKSADQKTEDLSNLNDRPSLGTCPKCKVGKICEGNRFYVCSNRANGACDWSMGKTILDSEISPEEVSTLLRGGASNPHLFRWSSGKRGQAVLTLVNGKLKFVFP